jgi:hypothetical protein
VATSPTTHDHVKQELGTTFHGALIRKDWAALRTILSQDVTWTLPGTIRFLAPPWASTR